MKNAIISIKGAGRKANGSPWLLAIYQKATNYFGERRLLFWFLRLSQDCRILINVTIILMIVTTIPVTPMTVSDIISCTFHSYFPYVSPPQIHIREVLKMYSFWQKVNRLPFRPTLVIIIRKWDWKVNIILIINYCFWHIYFQFLDLFPDDRIRKTVKEILEKSKRRKEHKKPNQRIAK